MVTERSGVEPTDELRWEPLALLCKWPEQVAQKEIRSPTLFWAFASKRACKIGSAERTLYGRVSPITRQGG